MLSNPSNLSTKAELQAAADALPSTFCPQALVLQSYNDFRLHNKPRRYTVSPGESTGKRPRQSTNGTCAVRMESITHVQAAAPSDETLNIPSAVNAACQTLSEREVRIAHAIASAHGVKVLQGAQSFRNVIPAVLALMREKGGAARVLLIVPAADVKSWAKSILDAQDEVSVSCFVNAAGAQRNCLTTLAKCTYPGVVIAARELLQRKTRQSAKAPSHKLYEALKEGGAARWEMVLTECSDTDLALTNPSFSMLQQGRVDTLILIGKEKNAARKLSMDKLHSFIAQNFQRHSAQTLELKLDAQHCVPERVSNPPCSKPPAERKITPSEHEPLQRPPRPQPAKARQKVQNIASDSASIRRRLRAAADDVDEDKKDVPFKLAGLGSLPTHYGRKGENPTIKGKELLTASDSKENLRYESDTKSDLSPSKFPALFSPHVTIKRRRRGRRPESLAAREKGSVLTDSAYRNNSATRADARGLYTSQQLRNVNSRSPLCTPTNSEEVIIIDSDCDADCLQVETPSPPSVARRGFRPTYRRNLFPKLSEDAEKRRPQTTPSAPLLRLKERLGSEPVKGRFATRPDTSRPAAGCRQDDEDKVQERRAHSTQRGSSYNHGRVMSDAASNSTQSKSQSQSQSQSRSFESLKRLPRRSNSMEQPQKRHSRYNYSHSSRTPSETTTDSHRPLGKLAQGDENAMRPRRSLTRSRSDTGLRYGSPPTVKFARPDVLPIEARLKYNRILRKAKYAERLQNQEEALRLYLLCHEISDHDKNLAVRILCFGDYAAHRSTREPTARSPTIPSGARSAIGARTSLGRYSSGRSARTMAIPGYDARTARRYRDIIVIDD